MLNHLIILQVIVPLLGAPCCLIVGRNRAAWLFALLVSAVSFLIACLLLAQVYDVGSLTYELGGWAPPWGIEYRLDLLSAWLLVIITLSSTVSLFAAQTSIQKEIEPDKQLFFYVAWLLCLAGLLGILSTGDAFNVFVFLEVSSLSTYTLIALGKRRQALWAAFRYLIMGTIGATFILIGIGFMYMMTGTLNMADLALRLPKVEDSQAVFVAYTFIVVGIGLKMAMFPLHFWLPKAYAEAPSIATAFLAASSTKVAVYLLIRFTYTVFDGQLETAALPLTDVLVALGVLAVFSASTTAIFQLDIKKAIAYSSVAQIGYMLIGIGLGSVLGMQATLLHLFNHALMKGGLFLSIAAIVYRLGSSQLDALNGLGKRMPITSLSFTIGGLSLIGVPLTVGFISKWYLVSAAIESGRWPLAMLIVMGSLLALAYIWRVVERLYFKESEAGAPTGEAPLMMLIPLWLLISANVYFGIDTRLPIEITAEAARSLLEGAR
ncbi:monovalent cation/H+ antiporter subunit D family protein [Zhongshania sp.]|uniref:monovalent cation/H+ antiporter subunit D family protein n=1 Tax=Zhongshania sp. TaxID=1971902 RepID=UPI0039E3C7E7